MNLRLDEGLVVRIDRARGLVPRNSWIVFQLEGVLEGLFAGADEADDGPGLEDVLAVAEGGRREGPG